MDQLAFHNCVPETSESASITQDSRLDNLAYEIDQKRRQLAELKHRYRLSSAFRSPIRRVPAEIWGQIFKLVLPNILDHHDRKALIKLQLVCKSWRRACLLTHRLWSGLSLNRLGRTVPCDKIGSWFKRAGNLPKSLAVVIPDHEHCDKENSVCRSFSPALATLLAKGAALEHLALECTRLECFQRFFESLATESALAPSPVPWVTLKSFGLRITAIYGSDDSQIPLKTIFPVLPPNITSLDLFLPDMLPSSASSLQTLSSPFPQATFQRLTSLTLLCEWGKPSWLANALKPCINLQSLTLDFDGSSWDNQESAEILIPNVRVLRLRNVFAYSMDILNSLKAPQLIELDVSFDREPSYDLAWPLAHPVLGFVKRSECDKTFRSFRLRDVDMYAEELLDTLQGLPFLTHVALEQVGATSKKDYRVSMFDLLVQPLSGYDSEGFLPALESLELLKIPSTSYDFGWEVSQYVRSRRPYRLAGKKPIFEGPCDTLKNLTVTYQVAKTYPPNLDSQILKTFKKWCGLKVNIGPDVD